MPFAEPNNAGPTDSLSSFFWILTLKAVHTPIDQFE